MRVDASTVLLAIALAAPAPATATAAADRDAAVLVDWNRRILALAEAEDGFLSLKGVRAAAMLHLAVHDAVNAVEPRFAPWAPAIDGSGADPVAAAAAAAHAVAADQYPARRAGIDAALAPWLAGLREDVRTSSVALGAAAARGVLQRRAGDGWDTEAEYTWHPMAPGVYAEFSAHSDTPEGFVFGAGWAKARPFVLEGAGQFRAPTPPAIDSAAYTRAFREVKELGRDGSATRTADQTHLAMWWKEFVEGSHNRLARDLVEREGTDLHAAARLFALLNMAVYDAYVCVFDNKFHYNHWRPYTAIRWAANDGNPDTGPDPDWDNTHGHTYAFPSYPSAHGCASAAAMTVLANTFGEPTAFTMRIPEVDRAGPGSGKVPMEPPTRSFDSFEAAALECALSRVFLGIHFRYDSEEGFALGRRVGEYVVAHALRRP